MKQISQVLSSFALAAAALWAPQAHAIAGEFSPISTYLGNGTYIGIMDPTVLPNETAFILSANTGAASLPTAGAFTNWWVLDVIPTGNTAANLNFLNIGQSFSAFQVELFMDQAPITNLALATYTCASQSQAAGAVLCPPTGPGALSPIATTNYVTGLGTQFGSAGAATNSFLTAGRYVVKVSGVTNGIASSNPSYSGTIQVNQIPEPGTLALAGLALLGAAVSLRKRQSTV